MWTLRFASIVKLVVLGLVFVIVATGCSNDQNPSTPIDSVAVSVTDFGDKNGTETLGVPSLTMASGSGFVEAGVGMVGSTVGQLELSVPDGVSIDQVLLYWAGGTTLANGDDSISIEGQAVAGTLIGGPVEFFTYNGKDVRFSSYRADITDLNLVTQGDNSLAISDFDFPVVGVNLDENNGCSIVVIYDDGTGGELSIVDGIDLAFFDFSSTLDSTAPQTFSFTPCEVARVADLLLIVASVGENRPNQVLVTTSAGVADYAGLLGAFDGPNWDSLTMPIEIPVGDDELTVQIVSTNSVSPLGASLAWVGAGLVVSDENLVTISGTVFVDADSDGQQISIESGIGNVVVDVTDEQGVVTSIATDENGYYSFCSSPGNYTVAVNMSDHSESFNDDLSKSFGATTELLVTVDGTAAGINFGFVPLPDAILADLDLDELSSNAQPLEYWRVVFRKAIFAERECLLGKHGSGCGHGKKTARDGMDHCEDEECDHSEDDEILPTAKELRAFLEEIAGLYQPEPYVFSEGLELWEAFQILKGEPASDEGLLFRELLVTELNFVSSLGLVDEADRLEVLISWGETLLVTPIEEEFPAKAGPDFRGAFRVFDAINTGGGGGVDE